MADQGSHIDDLKKVRSAVVERRRMLANRIATELVNQLSPTGTSMVVELSAIQKHIEDIDRMIADEAELEPVSDMRSHINTASRPPRGDVA